MRLEYKEAEDSNWDFSKLLMPVGQLKGIPISVKMVIKRLEIETAWALLNWPIELLHLTPKVAKNLQKLLMEQVGHQIGEEFPDWVRDRAELLLRLATRTGCTVFSARGDLVYMKEKDDGI